MAFLLITSDDIEAAFGGDDAPDPDGADDEDERAAQDRGVARDRTTGSDPAPRVTD